MRPRARAGAIAYMVSLNLKRRRLGESQRAMVAARIANLTLSENQFRGGGKFAGSTSRHALVPLGGRARIRLLVQPVRQWRHQNRAA